MTMADNENSVPFNPPSVLQTIKARHDSGGDARELVEELIEALVGCTIGWGCDPVEVARIYLDQCHRRSGR
jgi:hypothetical protein